MTQPTDTFDNGPIGVWKIKVCLTER